MICNQNLCIYATGLQFAHVDPPELFANVYKLTPHLTLSPLPHHCSRCPRHLVAAAGDAAIADNDRDGAGWRAVGSPLTLQAVGLARADTAVPRASETAIGARARAWLISIVSARPRLDRRWEASIWDF